MSDYVMSSSNMAAVHSSALPLVMHSEFETKYEQLGGSAGFLGEPTSEIRLCPDERGLYRHFQGGSLYWYDGQIYEIHGAIRDKWAELGWERSSLGYPISDEAAFSEDGRVSAFQNGLIYWWPDTGAIELNDVSVNFTGIVCFGETDYDQGSDSDEPYIVMGVLDPTGTSSLRSQVYQDVDAGESRADHVELYRGKPRGLTISTLIVEHDEEDPDKYKTAMQASVGAAFAGVTTLIAIIPVVGPFIAAVAGPLLAAVTPKVGEELNSLLDLGDDPIDLKTVAMSAKDMVLLAARTTSTEEKGITYKVTTPLLSGHGASYKAYFDLVPV